MTVFANRSYSLTGEITTLSYTWGLNKVPLSGGASPYREYPPSPLAVTMKVFGSLYVSGKLPTQPSPKPTFCLKWELSVKFWLRGGVGWQFPRNVPKFFWYFYIRTLSKLVFDTRFCWGFHAITGPLSLPIHEVQNRHAGEQKSHWDKTNKRHTDT